MWCKRCKAVVTNTTIICGGVTRTESSCPHPVFMKSKEIPPEAGLTPSADVQQDVGVDEADDTSEADTATTIASTVESVRLPAGGEENLDAHEGRQERLEKEREQASRTVAAEQASDDDGGDGEQEPESEPAPAQEPAQAPDVELPAPERSEGEQRLEREAEAEQAEPRAETQGGSASGRGPSSTGAAPAEPDGSAQRARDAPPAAAEGVPPARSPRHAEHVEAEHVEAAPAAAAARARPAVPDYNSNGDMTRARLAEIRRRMGEIYDATPALQHLPRPEPARSIEPASPTARRRTQGSASPSPSPRRARGSKGRRG